MMVVAILVGLLTAFAVQFLLTNLGLAIGISLLKYRPQTSEYSQSSQSKNSGAIANISFFAGLGILLTLNLVLFVACFLAIRFSTARDSISGVTLGIVIWSTYFLILLWASYNAVGSILSWVFGSVATKFRQLIETISTFIQKTDKSESELLTEEAAANLIQQEIQTALDEFDLQQRLEDYLKSIPQPQLDLDEISQGFADLLEKLDLESLAGTNLLQTIERQTFIDLIDERSNLSTSEVEQIVARLERVWQQAVEHYETQELNGELLQFLQFANLDELQFEQLIKRLEQLMSKEFERNSTDLEEGTPQSPGAAQTPQIDELKTNDNHNSLIKSWRTLDWRAIKNALLNRVDLSDVELEDIWYTLQSLYYKINSSEASPKLPFNTIRNDVEDYLWHAPSWYLNCEKGWQEFKEIIYDPQGDSVQVRSKLEQLQPEELVELLQQRDDLDSEKIKEIVEHLETVRQEVFASLQQGELSAHKQELKDRLKHYLQTVEVAELQGDNLSQNSEQLLIKSGVSLEVLTKFLSSWQQIDWQTWLQQRQDLEPKEQKQTLEQLEKIGDRLLEKVEAWQVQIISTARELQDKLESYLRYTHLEYLTPERIDAKLEELWHEARNNLPEMQLEVPSIDRPRLLEILATRKGLDVEQVEEIAEQIKTKLSELNGSSTQRVSKLQVQATELSENLLDYLETAIEQNLNLAEIEAELPQLLNLAKGETATLINQQLAQLNWDEIEARLKQVQKYSERQIKGATKQLREAIHKLIKLPRRWAIRTSHEVRNIIDELEDFLSYGNKIEFTSEHLESNLKSIINPSKMRSPLLSKLSNSGANNLDRLTKLTPANITQYLAYRQDLTPVEISQLSDRSMAIIHQISQEIKTQQEQTNKLVQHLLEPLGEYFSSLNLFNLDYDRLKDSLANFDFSSLTDSWQATIAETPLAELGDRLGQLSYKTLRTIMETNKLLNDSTLPKIQGIQDYIAQQIDTIKLTASQRTETIKQQTLQQIEATRKAIAIAAYWMFAIAFSSIVTSIVAGFLATIVDF